MQGRESGESTTGVRVGYAEGGLRQEEWWLGGLHGSFLVCGEREDKVGAFERCVEP